MKRSEKQQQLPKSSIRSNKPITLHILCILSTFISFSSSATFSSRAILPGRRLSIGAGFSLSKIFRANENTFFAIPTYRSAAQLDLTDTFSKIQIQKITYSNSQISVDSSDLLKGTDLITDVHLESSVDGSFVVDGGVGNTNPNYFVLGIKDSFVVFKISDMSFVKTLTLKNEVFSQPGTATLPGEPTNPGQIAAAVGYYQISDSPNFVAFGLFSPGRIYSIEAWNGEPTPTLLAGPPFEHLASCPSKDIFRSQIFYAVGLTFSPNPAVGLVASLYLIDTTLAPDADQPTPMAFDDSFGSSYYSIDQSVMPTHKILIGSGFFFNPASPSALLVNQNADAILKEVPNDPLKASIIGGIHAIPKFDGFFSITLASNNYPNNPQNPTRINLVDVSTPLSEPLVYVDLTSEFAEDTDILVTLIWIDNHKLITLGFNRDSEDTFIRQVDFKILFDQPCHPTCGLCVKEGADDCLTCAFNYLPTSEISEGETTSCTINPVKSKDCGGLGVANCVECSGAEAKTCKKCLLNFGLNASSTKGGTSCTQCEDEKCLVCNEGENNVDCQQCVIGVKYNNKTKKCHSDLLRFTAQLMIVFSFFLTLD